MRYILDDLSQLLDDIQTVLKVVDSKLVDLTPDVTAIVRLRESYQQVQNWLENGEYD